MTSKIKIARISEIALALVAACAIPLFVGAVVVPAGAQTTTEHNYLGWKQHVSAEDRARVNPLPADTQNIAAGAKLYSESCARCHGRDGEGIRKKPSLRGPDTQSTSDGELFWLLRNGDLYHGMPSWSAVPESERWQIIAYIRSLNMTSTSPTQAH